MRRPGKALKEREKPKLDHLANRMLSLDLQGGWRDPNWPKPGSLNRSDRGAARIEVPTMNRLHKTLDPSKTGRDAESLDKSLHSLIVGQDEAIDQIVNIYQMYTTGLTAPGRPIGNFLFLGPTGSGKTRTVEATAEALVSNARAIIKIDCAEFQHSHEIAKLIGSPPGYLGHRETHALLSQEVINQYQSETCRVSFILFDEIEKASDALWNLLLGILDKATLTLGDNRKVDFSQTLIFMTSNLGAGEMSNLMSPRLGFHAISSEPALAAASAHGSAAVQSSAASAPVTAIDEKMGSKIARSGVEAARRKFTPEFMNRIDKVVVFKPLGQSELRRILDLELRHVQQRILNATAQKPFLFQATEPAKEFLLSEGTDMKYGARHLKRAIERLVVQPLSNLIATEQVVSGDWVEIGFDAEQRRLLFHKEEEGLGFATMASMLAQISDRVGLPCLAAASSPEPVRNQAAKSTKK
jgi:ATP-dependent Clp protease ATP-binding subunit ClpB